MLRGLGRLLPARLLLASGARAPSVERAASLAVARARSLASPGESEKRQLSSGGKHDSSLLRIWTVPNALSVGRLVATPFIVHAVATGQAETAAIGFAAAAAADWLDGFIARRFNQSSVLGTFLDPLADKVLVGGVVIAMAASGQLSAPLVGLILFRDVALVSYGLLHRARTKTSDDGFFTPSEDTHAVEPSLVSKVNMAAQVSLISLCLANSAWGIGGAHSVEALSSFVAATTLLSGAGYMRDHGYRPPADRGKDDRYV
eukprot:PLAT12953.1.p1 GENE.PLAT12953.1~~PLAT12953.1.p1  ORF type:complete len:260 (-),score=30.93 PLAT12953.1:173-952(-)